LPCSGVLGCFARRIGGKRYPFRLELFSYSTMRSSMLIRLITLSLALLVALAIPATAAASSDEVIRDCAQDGDLDQRYSDDELEDASENMPSDVDAYSSCREVIRQAQAGGRGSATPTGNDDGGGAAGGGPGGGDGGGNEKDGSGGGATKGDLDELKDRADDAASGNAPTENPSLTAGADAGDDSGLPTPALVAIALLGLAAVFGGVYLLREYLPPGLSSRLPGASR
jgi:hypothetical protein